MSNIDRQTRDIIEDNIDDNGKRDLMKMRKRDLLVLYKITGGIYNHACKQCKKKMINKPSEFKNIDDMCPECQENHFIVNQFIKLQSLYGDING